VPWPVRLMRCHPHCPTTPSLPTYFLSPLCLLICCLNSTCHPPHLFPTTKTAFVLVPLSLPLYISIVCCWFVWYICLFTCTPPPLYLTSPYHPTPRWSWVWVRGLLNTHVYVWDMGLRLRCSTSSLPPSTLATSPSLPYLCITCINTPTLLVWCSVDLGGFVGGCISLPMPATPHPPGLNSLLLPVSHRLPPCPHHLLCFTCPYPHPTVHPYYYTFVVLYIAMLLLMITLLHCSGDSVFIVGGAVTPYLPCLPPTPTTPYSPPYSLCWRYLQQAVEGGGSVLKAVVLENVIVTCSYIV